jgi:hypothetical protein
MMSATRDMGSGLDIAYGQKQIVMDIHIAQVQASAVAWQRDVDGLIGIIYKRVYLTITFLPH